MDEAAAVAVQTAVETMVVNARISGAPVAFAEFTFAYDSTVVSAKVEI
jgi:hypothetical protein